MRCVPFRGLRAHPALLVLAFMPLAGCATKRDVRDLRDEIIALRAHQDSLMFRLQRQNDQLSDSLGLLGDVLLRIRGDFANELAQLEQQHVQIQELTGQSQRRISEFREQISERSARMLTPVDSLTDSTAAGPAASGDVEELYRIGSDNLQRGASSTARMAFEQILKQDPNGPRGADAQFGLAETYYLDKDYAQALQELEHLVEMYPNSERAPQALYRAGVIAEEQGNVPQARKYFQRVVAGYPKSDEARKASDELRRLRK